MSSDLKISQMTYSGARPTNAGIPWVGGVPTDNFRGNLLDLTGVYANFTAGDRALAGVPTASWPVAGGVYFVVNGGAIYPYLARAGTDAQNVPNIIRPTDYAAGTNEVVYDLLTFYTDGVIVGNGSLTDSTPGLVIAAGGAGNRNIFLNPTGIAGNVTIGNNGVLVLDSGAAQATFTAAGAATWTGAATLTPGAGLDLNVALSGSGKASITNSSGPSLYLNNSGTTATVSHMLYSSATSYGQLAYSPAGGANDGLILNDGRTDAQAKVMVKLQSSEMARFVAGNLLIGTTTNFGGPGNLILGGGAITAAGTNNLALTGGSSGASLVLGQGGMGGIFLSPKGTGKVGVGTVDPISTVTIGDAGGVIGAVDAQMTIARYVDDSTAGNGHGFTDASVISRGGGMAYNSYDTGVLFSGTNNYDHFTAFQSSITYSSSGTLSEYRGLTSNLVTTAGTVTSAYGAVTAMTIGGTVGTAYGLLVNNPTGAGGLTNNYGVYITELTKGSGSKYSIFAAGDTYSRFGNLEMGSVSASPTVRKVIKFNDGGYADPAAPGSTSSGDKLIFQDPGSSYRSAIGFNGSGHTWFQGAAFAWWTGAAPTNVMSLSGAGVLNIPGTTSATSPTSGALTIGNGTTAANVAIGGGNINAGGTLTVGGGTTASSAALSVNFGDNNRAGYAIFGNTPATLPGRAGVIAQLRVLNFDDTFFGRNLVGVPTADTSKTLESAAYGGMIVRYYGAIDWVGNSTSTAGAAITPTVRMSLNASGDFGLASTTPSTSTTTGSATFAGGVGIAGAVYVGGTGNFTSTVTAGAQIKATTGGLKSENTGSDGILTLTRVSVNDWNFKGGTNLTIDAGGAALTTLTPAGVFSLANTTEATTGGAGSLTTAGGIYAAKKIISASDIIAGGVTVLKNYTVATLPAAASYTYGTAFVSDATQSAGTGLGSAPTGGGGTVRLVYSTGSAWLLA